MYLQEIVEVAIGLVFSWLLLSVAVLQVQEIIATIMKKRAKDLEATIGNMLKDEDLLAKFYEHPIIQGLTEPISSKKAEKLATIKEKEATEEGLSLLEKYHKWSYTRRPSYIPPANFSAALFDVVVKAGTEESPIKSTLSNLNAELEKLADGDKEFAKALLDQIYQLGQMAADSEVGSNVQKELKQELKKQVEVLGEKYSSLATYTDQIDQAIDTFQPDLKTLFTSNKLQEQVTTGIKNLFKDDPESNLGKSLRSLIAGVNEYATDRDKALAVGRKNVEGWFDNTMDRMTGWYKRWAQTWAFVIGFVLAVTLNVDSIHIAQDLWHNPATRQASTVYIENFVGEKAKDGVTLEDSDLKKIDAEIQKLNFPVGWELEKYSGAGTVRLFASPTEIAGICPSFMDFNSKEEGEQPLFCYEIKNPPQNGAEILLKFLGFIFTALAAMLGAPFWFDVLKKLVNVRNTGVNPAEKQKGESTEAK